MQRITEKFIEAQVLNLNRQVGFNNPKYGIVGSYTIDYAYGGVSLHKYTNPHGGVKDVFRCGHIPKRELPGLISAYSLGLGE